MDLNPDRGNLQKRLRGCGELMDKEQDFGKSFYLVAGLLILVAIVNFIIMGAEKDQSEMTTSTAPLAMMAKDAGH